jgi:uncharacterized membrane protein YfcA
LDAPQLTPLISVLMFLFACFAGAFGSLLGIGGGVIIVPILHLVFKVPMHLAISTSLVSVIATSCSGNIKYLRQHYTDIRLAVILEVTTSFGALAGGMLATHISSEILRLIFVPALLYTAFSMSRKRASHTIPTVDESPDVSSAKLSLMQGYYFDIDLQTKIHYTVSNLKQGLAGGFVAGGLSGMLGIGGGFIKVPLMNLVMNVPLKVAIGTSTFMVGITATTSAVVYYLNSLIHPIFAGICALGILLGAQLGSLIGSKIRVEWLRWIFVAILSVLAVQMLIKSLF